jgi:hypothetical protein
VGRERSTDKDKTVKRRVDVAKAFATAEDSVELAATPGVPMDTIPTLIMPRADVPWAELSDLATKLLLRVDGATSTGAIATATGSIATPKECARELAALTQRGILKLEATGGAPSGDDAEELALDIDLSML